MVCHGWSTDTNAKDTGCPQHAGDKSIEIKQALREGFEKEVRGMMVCISPWLSRYCNGNREVPGKEKKKLSTL